MLHVPFKNNRSLIIIAITIKMQALKNDKLLKDLHEITMTEATKVCPIENNTNLDSILYLIKVSKIDFIVLPASYLSISL